LRSRRSRSCASTCSPRNQTATDTRGTAMSGSCWRRASHSQPTRGETVSSCSEGSDWRSACDAEGPAVPPSAIFDASCGAPGWTRARLGVLTIIEGPGHDRESRPGLGSDRALRRAQPAATFARTRASAVGFERGGLGRFAVRGRRSEWDGALRRAGELTARRARDPCGCRAAGV
jgi:hypothetical protein